MASRVPTSAPAIFFHESTQSTRLKSSVLGSNMGPENINQASSHVLGGLIQSIDYVQNGLNMVDLSKKDLSMNPSRMDVSRGYHGAPGIPCSFCSDLVVNTTNTIPATPLKPKFDPPVGS